MCNSWKNLLSRSTIIETNQIWLLLKGSLMRIKGSRKNKSTNSRKIRTKLKKWRSIGRGRRNFLLLKMRQRWSDSQELLKMKLKSSEFKESPTRSKKECIKPRSRRKKSAGKNRFRLMRRSILKRSKLSKLATKLRSRLKSQSLNGWDKTGDKVKRKRRTKSKLWTTLERS